MIVTVADILKGLVKVKEHFDDMRANNAEVDLLTQKLGQLLSVTGRHKDLARRFGSNDPIVADLVTELHAIVGLTDALVVKEGSRSIFRKAIQPKEIAFTLKMLKRWVDHSIQTVELELALITNGRVTDIDITTQAIYKQSNLNYQLSVDILNILHALEKRLGGTLPPVARNLQDSLKPVVEASQARKQNRPAPTHRRIESSSSLSRSSSVFDHGQDMSGEDEDEDEGVSDCDSEGTISSTEADDPRRVLFSGAARIYRSKEGSISSHPSIGNGSVTIQRDGNQYQIILMRDRDLGQPYCTHNINAALHLDRASKSNFIWSYSIGEEVLPSEVLRKGLRSYRAKFDNGAASEASSPTDSEQQRPLPPAYAPPAPPVPTSLPPAVAPVPSSTPTSAAPASAPATPALPDAAAVDQKVAPPPEPSAAARSWRQFEEGYSTIHRAKIAFYRFGADSYDIWFLIGVVELRLQRELKTGKARLAAKGDADDLLQFESTVQPSNTILSLYDEENKSPVAICAVKDMPGHFDPEKAPIFAFVFEDVVDANMFRKCYRQAMAETSSLFAQEPLANCTPPRIVPTLEGVTPKAAPYTVAPAAWVKFCPVCGKASARYAKNPGLDVQWKVHQQCEACMDCVIPRPLFTLYWASDLAVYTGREAVLCSEHFKKRNAQCAKCHKLISPDDVKVCNRQIMDVYFHKGCATCWTCARNFAASGSTYISVQTGRVFCTKRCKVAAQGRGTYRGELD
ncbi:hypothetical protein JCM6882_000214 [Rhodosporidiobolus microsporus]